MSTKKLKDGQLAIMVRFKHNGKTYPVKNFTKLFGSKTQKQAFNTLQEVKISLSKGIDPFNVRGTTIDELYNEYIKSVKWSKSSLKINNGFYQLKIKKFIGHKKIQKVTLEDLDRILLNLKDNSPNYRNKFKDILNPIFNIEVRKKTILENPLIYIINDTSQIKPPIDERSISDSLFIGRELYRCIPMYEVRQKSKRNEIKIFFMMLLLTSHRYGEILKLRKEDIYDNMVISPKEITKTNKPYSFPLPPECKEYVDSIKNGLLFPNVVYGSVTLMFRRIVNTTDIKLIKDKLLTPHDIRRIFMSIMTQNNFDALLIDACLEHTQSGVIKHYLKFDYKEKEKIFQRYWDILRGNDTKSKELETSKHTEITLEKLIEMYSENMITKEEFLTMKKTLD